MPGISVYALLLSKLVFTVFHREYGNKGTIFHFLFELNNTICEGKQGMVFAHTDVEPGIMNRSALPYDNAACLGELPAKDLHTQSFAV